MSSDQLELSHFISLVGYPTVRFIKSTREKTPNMLNLSPVRTYNKRAPFPSKLIDDLWIFDYIH